VNSKADKDSQFIQYQKVGEAYRWKNIEVKNYTAAGTLSSGVTKQILFVGSDELAAEVRYFEAEPGGYSALERHNHIHFVFIVRGRGRAVIDNKVQKLETFDSIVVPSQTWHQFYADPDTHLGFLCLVNTERDTPQRPTPEQLKKLLSIPSISDIIRY
jgi:quercetin dioxygenase-like cupin family protein